MFAPWCPVQPTGVVALSLASSPNLKDKGRYAEIPATEYPPIGSDREKIVDDNRR
jgi:hypothetical protein